MRLKLNLHDIYSDSEKLKVALTEKMNETKAKRAKSLEIITGKGSGQLKKKVLRFLETHYKGIYQRIEKDERNWGRIFVHFRWP